jgi:hypothetical protein
MPDSSGLSLAWLLFAASLYNAYRLPRESAKRQAQRSEPYPILQALRDSGTPLGMAFYALRVLLIGYGAATPESGLCRIALFLATVGIVGGIASWKISRLPID